MSKTGPATIIRLLDYEGLPEEHPGPLPHKVFRVEINGQPVRVAPDSVKISFGEKEATTVTLTLQPDAIHFERA